VLNRVFLVYKAFVNCGACKGITYLEKEERFLFGYAWKKWLLALILIPALLLGTPALAGDGDGSGGGHDQPLLLLSSQPAGGAREIAPPDNIQLHFNKNVIYLGIREKNQRCFALFEGNNPVAISVVMADDQLEFEKRRDITVQPQAPLQAGKTYTLRISGDLEAKSGATLGKDVTIQFTTAADTRGEGKTSSEGSHSADTTSLPDSTSGSPSGKEAPAIALDGANRTDSSPVDENGKPVPDQQDKAGFKGANPEKSTSSSQLPLSDRLGPIIIGAVGGALAGWLFLRWKRGRQ